ncbi:MAG TPA: recombinase family protein, partial [Epulopiscium sp.]|nr:recombinase family protein [Candidatus Epulonipiscium sp.]
TNTKKREQFNKMITDCKAGKIDVIITKSISRFARNTLDCLNYVRQLKDLGVGIIFEKENIDTLDAKGEVLLTILSSLAQDESRSISENCTWGIRRRFEQGKVQVNHKQFLGYTKDEEGNLVINKKQADTVKRIYTDYLAGKGPNRIAKELGDDGILNWNGKTKWYGTTIKSMLSNEKYKGDAILQKTYTVNFLTKERAINKGEVPMYYVEESHPAIIEKDMWEAVQLEMDRRNGYMERHGVKQLDFVKVQDNPFTGRVICGECGSSFGRKTWNSTNEDLKRRVWQCNRKYEKKGEVRCGNKHVDEEVLFKAFVSSFNALVENREHFIDIWKAEEGDELKRYKVGEFIEIVGKGEGIEEFDVDLYFRMVEKMTVLGDEKVVVSFLDGTEVECVIE